MHPPNSQDTPLKNSGPPPAQVKRLVYQYLLHNFLYFYLHQPLISDDSYDCLAQKLWQIQQKYPKISMPYQKLIKKSLGPEASAFNIRSYPPHIITTALKLLYQQSGQETDFSEFLAHKGFYSLKAQPLDAQHQT